MEKIKVGLASFGMSGRLFHSPFIASDPNFELYKIVERSKNLSEEEYPNAIVVRSFDELINDPAIELIIVNTPDSTHYPYAKQALLANKHVVVEKPFTLTSKEGEELIALAEERKLMLSVFQNRRWDSDFLTVQDIIKKGLLGRLVEFESTFPRYRNFIKEGTWKETGELGGGLTYNLGSHLIDQALVLFGMPQSIYAEIETQRDGGMVDDYFFIRLHYPHIKVSLKAGYLMKEAPPRFVLNGTLGSYVKYGLDPQEEALNAGQKPVGSEWGKEPESDWGIINSCAGGKEQRERYPSLSGNYASFYQNISEHIRKNKPLASDAKEVINSIRIIEAAFKSHQTKTIIRL